MFSVFKEFSNIAFALIILTTTTDAIASCATLSFNTGSQLKMNKLTLLSKVDNQSVRALVNEFDRNIISEMEYHINPGLHSLHVGMLPYNEYDELGLERHLDKITNFGSNDLRKTKAALAQLLASKLQTIQLAMQFEANTRYDLGFDQQGNLTVLGQATHDCKDNNDVVGIKPNANNELGTNQLSQELANTMRQVMVEIALNNPDSLNNTLYFSPLKPDYNFGLVLDDRYDNNSQALVLSVFPNSIAYEIGLRSGDRIKAINGNNLAAIDQDPIVAFSQALTKFSYYSNVEFNIARNGRPKSLTSEILPKLIPQTFFAFDQTLPTSVLATNNKLSNNLASRFDLVVSELYAELSKSMPNEERLEINAPLIEENELGIVILKETNHLQVDEIKEFSELKRSGLKSGDVILSIGDQQDIVDSPADIIRYFNHLKPGDPYQLVVLRNSESKELTGNYYKQEAVNLTFVLDLASYRLGMKALEKHKRYSKKLAHVRSNKEEGRFVPLVYGPWR